MGSASAENESDVSDHKDDIEKPEQESEDESSGHEKAKVKRYVSRPAEDSE